MHEIKLIISHHEKIVQTVTKEVDNSNFVNTIEQFQEIANRTLTQMIEEGASSGVTLKQEEAEGTDDSEDEDICSSPKILKK